MLTLAFLLWMLPSALADENGSDGHEQTMKAIDQFADTLDALVPGSERKASTAGSRPEDADLTVEIVGRQYGWQQTYRRRVDGVPETSTCALSGPISVPQGKAVLLVLTSDDIIHEWRLPSLDLEIDAVPGRREALFLDTSRAGRFSGGASPASGSGYGSMAFELHILTPPEYAEWERLVLKQTCEGD